MLVMNLEYIIKKVLIYDDEFFFGMCESNVYLVLISNEVEVLFVLIKSWVWFYFVIWEWFDGIEYNVILFFIW